MVACEDPGWTVKGEDDKPFNFLIVTIPFTYPIICTVWLASIALNYKRCVWFSVATLIKSGQPVRYRIF